jgi:hypothetical protein
MSYGLHVGFCLGFTSDANNFMWSINGCDIFIDFVNSGQLFVDFSYVFKKKILKLDVPMCNPNVFGQYFDPYISLGLEHYGIPLNSCSTNDDLSILLHLVFFLVHLVPLIICPTFVIVCYILNCQITFDSNSGDAMLSKFETGDGTKLDPLIRDPILKSQFLDLDENEVDNLIKVVKKLASYGFLLLKAPLFFCFCLFVFIFYFQVLWVIQGVLL